MGLRVLRATILMVSVFCCAGPAWAGELRAQEATLYVGAPADVRAVVIADGASATFDLPKLLLTGSVRATQGQAVVPVSLEPVFVPGEDPLKPELDRYRAEVTRRTEEVPIEVRFRTGGLGWTPSIVLDVAGEKGRITAQASITNGALGLDGARVRLMSGGSADVERLPPDLKLDSEWLLRTMWRSGRSREGGGLQLVGETTGSEVSLGATTQIPLLSGAVAVERSYLWDTGPRENDGPSAPERIHAIYSFVNDSGQALPEGIVTVAEGATAAGDGYLLWTPAGETAVIAVGTVQGLTAKRKHETTPMPTTWETQHRVTLQVESTRAEVLNVRVAEHLWDEWDYGRGDAEGRTYEFSRQPDEWKEDLLAWSLPVPPQGRAEVSYSYAATIDLGPLSLMQIVPDDSPQERQYISEVDRAAVQIVRDRSQQRIRRIQPDGYVVYRLPIPANVTRADLTVGGANTLRVSLAPQADGKPGPFTVVADLVAIAGRPVNDAQNYGLFTFDLAPFLGENHVAYVKLDNPWGGEAFFAWVEAFRVPEGFPSRSQQYAVGETPAVASAPGAAPAGPRHILFSFLPATADEEKSILFNRGTVVVDKARVAYLSNRMIYSFTVPPDVTGAYLIVDAWGSFVLAAAGDVGGAPGEFHEEVNTPKLFGRKVYMDEAKQDYPVDLTPYLRENPSRTIYVALSSADPTTGWGGAAWRRVEVAALDDAEQARLARLRRRLDLFVKDDHARYPLDLRTNSEEAERPYLYEDRGSRVEPMGRTLEGDATATYRLPLKPEYRGHQVRVWVLGDFLVSYATDDHGKPGVFTDVLRARDKYDQRTIEEHGGVPVVVIHLTEAMLGSGAIYIKIRDGAPDEPGDVQIHQLSTMRP